MEGLKKSFLVRGNNIVGFDGSGEENTIESISVNGVDIAPDENKNIDITIPSIDGLTKDADLATVAKSGNYEDLNNKPEIPSIEGLARTTDIPTKVSQLENDSKYQTESDVITTLTDYATKTYVGEQIANTEHLKREIVTVLPSNEEASDNIIYMLKVESATGNDKYQEYMKIDGAVQMVGDTSVDLTDYAKIAEIPTTVAELTDSADYAKSADIPTSLPANGGNADTVNNHTVESNVPADAVFTDTTYESVTQTEDGLMSAADKAKLDRVEEGATKTLIDIGLSSTSTNPVQNKVVTDALNNKADKSKYSDTTINVGRKASTTVGAYSTAEGQDTTASASYAHSEGVNTSAIGQGSHAEGSNLEKNRYNEIVFEEPRRVELYDGDTDDFIYITVAGSQAFGLNSHAEGCSTLAYGKNSHTEGYHTVAAANESHAEGCGCKANEAFAHAEGQDTTADGRGAHAEGFSTTASGTSSHAEGFFTRAIGTYSHAEGYRTTADNYASHASGKYNTAMTKGGVPGNTTGTAFVIGNGTSDTALSNAFSVQYDGTVKAKSTITASTTADYAEFFEWLDKNPNEEDRIGHFVTLDGDKIKIATSEDNYILGIVSGEPFVLGNGDCDTWNGMYLHDEFRRTMYEPAPKMIEILDSEGNSTGEYEEVEGEYEGTRPILNPDYDQTKQYISRFDRAEWSPIGMLGVLAVLHDGTAEVNGYVTVNDEGIATKCTRDTRNSYRVIKKVSDKVVEVIFR